MAVRPGRGSGDDSRPTPGMFQSYAEFLIMLTTLSILLLGIAVIFGSYSHIVYKLFMWGWDLIG